MNDQFTERVKQVLFLARDEAARLQHDYIGTEHFLLGIVREGEGIAAKVLQKLGLSLEQIQQEVEKLVGPCADTLTIGEIPFTPRAKRVLELSEEEARSHGYSYIDTEHLLLGLIREGTGVAARVLIKLGANEDRVRKEVLRLGSDTVLPLQPRFRDQRRESGSGELVYLWGSSLARRLEGGALPMEEVLRIGSKIAETVEKAHKMGLVNLDLQPGSIHLTPEGQVELILVFGEGNVTASVMETSAAKGMGEAPAIRGTLPYMAPEQIRGGAADPRTDLYSLGVILYEMSTGRRPFEATSMQALIHEILELEPEPPRRLMAELPQGIDSVILKCLQKDPGRRYESARELLDDLRHVT